jgi:hypothetical protein
MFCSMYCSSMQHDVGHGGDPFLCYRSGKGYGFETKDTLQSPASVAGTKNGFFCKV